MIDRALIDFAFIAEWADALESGEFAQGKGTLRSNDEKFCCLGVACELKRRKEPNDYGWVRRAS